MDCQAFFLAHPANAVVNSDLEFEKGIAKAGGGPFSFAGTKRKVTALAATCCVYRAGGVERRQHPCTGFRWGLFPMTRTGKGESLPLLLAIPG